MSDLIRSVDQPQGLGAPVRKPAAVEAAPAQPVQAADSLALSAAPLLQADVALRLRGSTSATANGTINVDHRFIERFTAKLFGSDERFKGVKLAFDPALGANVASGRMKWLGFDMPFDVPVRLVADQGKLGVAFDKLHVQLLGMRIGVPDFLAKRLMTQVVGVTRNTCIQAIPDPDHSRVLIEPNSLLRELGLLPMGLRIDLKRTSLTATTSPRGDVEIALSSGDGAKPAKTTPGSDLSVDADRGAMVAVLREALGRDYEVQSIEPSPGGFTLKGTAEYKPLSDAVNGMKGIFAILALASGQGAGVQDMRMEQARGPLALAVKVDGTRLTIKPSMDKAVGPVAKALEDQGFRVTQTKKDLEVDLAQLVADKPVSLEEFALGADGIQAKAHLDLDKLLRADQLAPTPREVQG